MVDGFFTEAEMELRFLQFSPAYVLQPETPRLGAVLAALYRTPGWNGWALKLRSKDPSHPLFPEELPTSTGFIVIDSYK